MRDTKSSDYIDGSMKRSIFHSKKNLSDSSVHDFHNRHRYDGKGDCNLEDLMHSVTVSSQHNKKQIQNVENKIIYSGYFWPIGIGENPKLISDVIDIAIRIVLVIVFCKMETITAFKRVVHIEELWLYKYPRSPDFVSPLTLLLSVTFGPFILTLLQLVISRDIHDFRAANWSWTLCLCLNGLTTSLLKVSVGRLRPDYFYRCFPDGVMRMKDNETVTIDIQKLFNCTGSLRDINEGRKSFPSGHSSFAFASFGFIMFYMAGKLHTFNRRGRGETWRLCITIIPIILATLVSISRTCDYHHHWQDALVGSIIGIIISYIVYRQYYPSLSSFNSHRPYLRNDYTDNNSETNCKSLRLPFKRRLHVYKRLATDDITDDCMESQSFLNEWFSTSTTTKNENE